MNRFRHRTGISIDYSLSKSIFYLAPNSPANSSILTTTTTFADTNSSIIKSTNFPAIRHKNEGEIDIQIQQQQRSRRSASILSPNKRVPTIVFDETTFPSQYQTSKRRLLAQTTATTTTTSSDEKFLRELTECQVNSRFISLISKNDLSFSFEGNYQTTRTTIDQW